MTGINFYKKITVFIFLAMGLFSFNPGFGFFMSFLMHGTRNVAFAQQTIRPDSTATSSVSILDSKKQTLSDALAASYNEIDELKNELASTTVTDKDWGKIKESLINQADEIKAYYDKESVKFNGDGNDLESIKSLAKELKAFRGTTFSEYLKKSINFILIFQEADLLKTADNRLNKISSDINRLERQSPAKANALKPILEEAKNNLKSAHYLNNSAKNLLYDYFNPESQKTADEEIVAKTSEPEQASTMPADPQQIIRDISQKSLEELKATYEAFIEMSKAVL